MGMLLWQRLQTSFFPPGPLLLPYLHSDPVLRISVTMKNTKSAWAWSLKLFFLCMCSDRGARVLFPTRGALRETVAGMPNWKLRSWPFVPFLVVRGYSGKQKSKRKYSLRWAEIGQNMMRHKWKKKKRKKEKEKKKREKGVFLYQKRFFSENCLKLATLSTFGSLQEAMHCYLN